MVPVGKKNSELLGDKCSTDQAETSQGEDAKEDEAAHSHNLRKLAKLDSEAV